jgi:hypothetical protein
MSRVIRSKSVDKKVGLRAKEKSFYQSMHYVMWASLDARKPWGFTLPAKSKQIVNFDELEEEPPRSSTRHHAAATDAELEKAYDASSSRILQERNDFFLPQVRDFVSTNKWVNLRPEYQRRHRWDVKKQSRLVESLLMNVPVPPVFLFEWELNRYEVMDGQQRLVSLIDFYDDKLELAGLEAWPGLNGRRYRDLPPKLKRGLDRRRISAVVLLAESISFNDLTSKDIRREVFERLNTGGTALNQQELRNCIYAGPFNQLIIRLAALKLFRNMWKIPNSTAQLKENKLFQTMSDCQIVLRFFAFREEKNISGSVRRMLDKSMEVHQNDEPGSIKRMEKDFEARLKLVHTIFGVDAFVLPDDSRHSRPLFDAVMIAMDRLWDRRDELLSAKTKLKEKLASLLRQKRSFAVIIGRPNTALAVKARINLVTKSFRSVIER